MAKPHPLRVVFLPLGEDHARTRQVVSYARTTLATVPFRILVPHKNLCTS